MLGIRSEKLWEGFVKVFLWFFSLFFCVPHGYIYVGFSEGVLEGDLERKERERLMKEPCKGNMKGRGRERKSGRMINC